MGHCWNRKSSRAASARLTYSSRPKGTARGSSNGICRLQKQRQRNCHHGLTMWSFGVSKPFSLHRDVTVGGQIDVRTRFHAAATTCEPGPALPHGDLLGCHECYV